MFRTLPNNYDGTFENRLSYLLFMPKVLSQMFDSVYFKYPSAGTRILQGIVLPNNIFHNAMKIVLILIKNELT